MAAKPRPPYRRRAERSPAQEQWNAAVGLASKAWEALTDQQRRSYNTEGKNRRTSGHRVYVQQNAGRIRDGLEPRTELPERKAYSGKLLLKQLLITNRSGRITLKLEVSHAPGVRVTVWASRPVNRGVSRRPKCPRLGDLPAPAGGLSDITRLYFAKHGPYIMEHRLPMVGKRIFVLTRVELDDGPGSREATDAVVP
jgi:hypothetical protein